ncbi:MAG: hypothetical protein JW822_08920 [Spirochaetales bacterium]|nr:hypothetical protein [Spirochaetales bacterium]
MEKKKKLTTIDFSQKSVNKAVLGDIFQNPVSTYITALAGIFLFANIMILGIPALLYATIGAVVLGIGSFFVNLFFRKEHFASKYLNHINTQMEIQQQKILINLKRDLAKYRCIKGLENYSEQAVKQFEKIQKKFSSFKRLLSEKYDAKELTYARYFGTAEQVYLSTLDNLTDIMNTLESVSTIDLNYVDERFTYLKSLTVLEEADKREIETLNKRTELRKQQLEKINELLTLNEEAMTQIDLSLATISEAKTKLGRASMDMETARQELQELIRRTKKYSKAVH